MKTIAKAFVASVALSLINSYPLASASAADGCQWSCTCTIYTRNSCNAGPWKKKKKFSCDLYRAEVEKKIERICNSDVKDKEEEYGGRGLFCLDCECTQ